MTPVVLGSGRSGAAIGDDRADATAACPFAALPLHGDGHLDGFLGGENRAGDGGGAGNGPQARDCDVRRVDHWLDANGLGDSRKIHRGEPGLRLIGQEDEIRRRGDVVPYGGPELLHPLLDQLGGEGALLALLEETEQVSVCREHESEHQTEQGDGDGGFHQRESSSVAAVLLSQAARSEVTSRTGRAYHSCSSSSGDAQDGNNSPERCYGRKWCGL